MTNINIYDQSNIPDNVFQRMKRLKEVNDGLKIYQNLLEEKNTLLKEIEAFFPKDNNAIAVKDGITVYWKLGRRNIGNANLEELEKIDPYLVREIPEKIIPAERKAQTLGKIEQWIETQGDDVVLTNRVFELLDIKQSKSLVMDVI